MQIRRIDGDAFWANFFNPKCLDRVTLAWSQEIGVDIP